MTDDQIRRVLGGDAEAPELTFERRYRTDAAGLWGALTDPTRLARWFGTFDGSPPVRVGDHFRVDLGGGADDTAEGTVRACDPNRHLAYDWRWQGEAPSTVTVDLAPDGDATILLLTHRLAEPDHLVGYGGGWEDMLLALEEQTGGPVIAGRRAAAEAQGQQAWTLLAQRAAQGEVLRLTHESALTPAQVWQAFTTTDGLAAWWWPSLGTTYDLDLRVGGHYRFEASQGGFAVAGTYLSLDPEVHLAFSWVWSDADGEGTTDRVDVHLQPHGTGSLVRIEHRGPWMDPEQAGNYREGWESVLLALG